MRVPKKEDEDRSPTTADVAGGAWSTGPICPCPLMPTRRLRPSGVRVEAAGESTRGNPADAGSAFQPEVIGEIRIHGNAFLTDKEVLDFAGIAVGQPLAADGIEAITQRLKDSGSFETVEVRKRYRSLDQHHRRRHRPGGAREAGRALGDWRGQHPWRARHGRPAGRAGCAAS